MTEIIDITAREILDSRGNPTVEVDVVLLILGSLGLVLIKIGLLRFFCRLLLLWYRILLLLRFRSRIGFLMVI